jgi:hypothetical protein
MLLRIPVALEARYQRKNGDQSSDDQDADQGAGHSSSVERFRLNGIESLRH